MRVSRARGGVDLHLTTADLGLLSSTLECVPKAGPCFATLHESRMWLTLCGLVEEATFTQIAGLDPELRKDSAYQNGVNAVRKRAR